MLGDFINMQSLSGTVFEILQMLSVLCIILIAYFKVRRGLINKKLILDIPGLLWVLHGFIFYTVVFASRYGIMDVSNIFVSSWSTALRFQGYATILLGSIVDYLLEKNKWIQH